MLKVTCFKCHANWTYPNEAVEAMLEDMEEGQNHVPVECPRCRRINKVSLRQLQRALPRISRSSDDDAAK